MEHECAAIGLADAHFDFDDAPILVSQVSSLNGLQTVTTRHNNISQNSFSAQFLEEEDGDDVHAAETVSWIALKDLCWEPVSTT